MTSLEELNKLKLANQIINRSSNKLGVKPLYISNVPEDIKPEIKTRKEKPKIQSNAKSFEKKSYVANDLNFTAKKLKKEKKEFKFDNKSFINITYIVIAIIIATFMVLAFKPVDLKNGFTKVSQAESLDSTVDDTKTVDDGRNLVICSGSFKRELEAKRYKHELAERLGVVLKVIRDGSLYTIQVGPSYQNHDDALIVFDELSRYSIKNLSLRFEKTMVAR